jgi:hypothetical protein
LLPRKYIAFAPARQQKGKEPPMRSLAAEQDMRCAPWQ